MMKFLNGLFLFIVILPQNALAIICYICGQTNLQPPGECTTQFQFDCSAMLNGNNGGRTGSPSKQLCRTTRSRIGENLYSVGKECITEHDHLTRYPNGRTIGCDTLDKNGVHELTYCLCDRDMCNARNIDDQMVDYGVVANVSGTSTGNHQQQPAINFNNSGPNNNQVIVSAPQSGINVSISTGPFQGGAGEGKTATGRPQGQAKLPVPADFPTAVTVVDDDDDDDMMTSPLPAFVLGNDESSSSLVGATVAVVATNTKKSPLEFKPLRVTIDSTNNNNNNNNSNGSVNGVPPSGAWQTQNVETHHAILSTTNRDKTSSFTCLMCADTNLPINEDCKEQVDVDCTKLVPGTINMFCLTKVAHLANDKRMVEKRCMTEESAINELGLSSPVEEGCDEMTSSTTNFQYCLCSSNKCNNQSLFEQIGKAGGYLRNSVAPKSTTFSINNDVQKINKLMCYACVESNLPQNVDCSNQYANDCSNGTIKMMCLTRQTKLPNGVRYTEALQYKLKPKLRNNGLYSMEKRCMSETEQQQHPGLQQVPMNGCAGAWNNNEEHYCLCNTSYCNKENNITAGQQQHVSNLITTDTNSDNNRKTTDNSDNRKFAITQSVSKSVGSFSLITAEPETSSSNAVNNNNNRTTFKPVDNATDHTKKMVKSTSTIGQQRLNGNNVCRKLPNFIRTLFIAWALIKLFIITQ